MPAHATHLCLGAAKGLSEAVVHSTAVAWGSGGRILPKLADQPMP